MKTVFTFFLGCVLSVCLALYGSFSMASPQGGAVFSMEICAGGSAKTVLLDADGNPVEPAVGCPECLTCCQAADAVFPANWSANPSFYSVEMALKHLSAEAHIVNKRHILPAPRGPRVVQLSMPIKAGLTLVDQTGLGQITRSGGRLLLRDAFA